MRTLPALLLTLALTACSPGSAREADSALKVTAAFYPYAFLVEQVGGEDVQLTTLTQPGAEPHDLELTPRQVGSLGESDLVVYARGFQPALDEVVGQQAKDTAFDVHEVARLAPQGQGADPHVWLDPTRYAGIAEALARRLGELDPDGAAGYTARAQELRRRLQALDAELRAGLATCARREIVTSHAAFGYLAARYDLEQIAVTGLTPEEEPTPRRLAEVAQLAKERGVTTVFFEELVSPRTAESLAREVGARAVVLSPLEGPPASGDYFSTMRENLVTLRTALGCT